MICLDTFTGTYVSLENEERLSDIISRSKTIFDWINNLGLPCPRIPKKYLEKSIIGVHTSQAETYYTMSGEVMTVTIITLDLK